MNRDMIRGIKTTPPANAPTNLAISPPVANSVVCVAAAVLPGIIAAVFRFTPVSSRTPTRPFFYMPDGACVLSLHMVYQTPYGRPASIFLKIITNRQVLLGNGITVVLQKKNKRFVWQRSGYRSGSPRKNGSRNTISKSREGLSRRFANYLKIPRCIGSPSGARSTDTGSFTLNGVSVSSTPLITKRWL